MQRIRDLFGIHDKTFYRTLLQLSVPIVVQQALTMLLFMLDNVMVARLGDEAIAATGQASQVYFLMTLFNFGVISGIAIFVAQYWGQKDIPNIRRMQGIALTLMGAFTLAFVAIAQFMPRIFMGMYGDDARVIELGVQYLRCVSIAYLFQALSQAFGLILRSCEIAVLPMISAAIGVLINGVLNYGLIFGKLGLPEMGVAGAGIATSIAAAADCAIILSFSYLKQTPAAASLRELRFSKQMMLSYIKVGWSVFVNEVMWSLGVAVCFVIYGRLGTQASAAMQINQTIDRLVFVINIAVGSAGGVMIGNRIGANEAHMAKLYAKRMIVLSVCSGTVITLALIFGSPLLIRLFHVSGEVQDMLLRVQRVFACFVLVQSVNYTLLIGILRPGGDTLGSSRCEIAAMWLVSVPLVFLLGMVFHAPVWVCYIAYLSGDLVKIVTFSKRYRGNWANDVTRAPEIEPEPAAA